MALTSAALLILSFPSFNQPWCAWVALVPWLLLLREVSDTSQSGGSVRHLWRAVGWSWFIGFCFFLGSIWWLIHVTLIGWIVLCAYLALFFGAFGWFAARPQTSARHILRSEVWSLMSAPAAWVALEYLRAHLFSGFGWNLLAYSQTPWRTLIQCADLTGAWGISFLIVLFNVAIVTWLAGRDRMRPLVIAGMCMATALGYGAWRVPHVIGSRSVRVAVVQGGIPQEEKWDAAFQQRIQERYASLTREAAATNPDLIVWPETSVPGFLGAEEEVTRPVTELARSVGRPLLVGAPVPAFSLSEGWLLNSAMLIESSGRLSTRYDKLHLVPFGEFIPGESFLPWLRLMLPPIGAFVPGHSYTVFRIPVSGSKFQVSGSVKNNLKLEAFNLELSFSTLICFEDVFPELARRFVQEGAKLLVVMTNDAWFGPTAAAYQHAQASTFRAVELRVPVARVANTGWSGFIDASGRWMDRVHEASGRELFIPGIQTCDVPLGTADSVYRRWGDWFAWLCVLGCLGWVGFAIIKR